MSEYAMLTPEKKQQLLNNFVVSSWSYSKITSFARNEKAFEMQSVFGVYSRKSATSIAGSAYHNALEYYFKQMKEGKIIDLVELEQSAFQYIDEVPGNQWKLSVTLPTVDECRAKANESASKLLRNFMAEIVVYTHDIDEVIDVEVKCEEWLTINGVDIPMPCHMKIDLIVKTKSGKIAIVDHKSKTSFTDDAEIALAIGAQAITYVKGYESKTGINVDEVWFIENKIGANKDKSRQLRDTKIEIDENTRRLYESLLYEPLKRMLEATSNPDYVYIINEADNYVDKAEIYDFWARTQICEVGDFNVEESKKDIIANRLRRIRNASGEMITPQVIRKFKENAASFIKYDLSTSNMTTSEKIEHVLRSFGIMVKVAHEFSGYSSNTHLLEFSAGTSVKTLYAKRLDLANGLDVANVRISNEMVVYEGKSYMAVEYSKNRTEDLIFDPANIHGMKIPLGRDNFGNLIVWDWKNHSTPHMLICGGTGSGKSVLIKCIIESAKRVNADAIIIMDPKFEFAEYAGGNITVIQGIEKIEEQMAFEVEYMNELVETGRKEIRFIAFDEFADAVDQSRKGKDLDIYRYFTTYNEKGKPKREKQFVRTDKSLSENLKMILQKGRSSGYRILCATQRASTNVINGDTKVNLTVQVCLRVQKEIDSRVVLDEAGAESLAGYGDGLIKSPEYGSTTRFQSFYIPETAHA